MDKSKRKIVYGLGIVIIGILFYFVISGPPLPQSPLNPCLTTNYTVYYVQQNISIVYKNCTLSYIHRGI